MGIKNYIDQKGFWSERTNGDLVEICISGSLTQTDGSVSYYSPITGISDSAVLSSTIRSDSFLMVDASARNLNVILPPITANGFRLTIKKIDQTSNTVTVQGSAVSEKIDEENSKIIALPFSTMRLITFNNKWWIF